VGLTQEATGAVSSSCRSMLVGYPREHGSDSCRSGFACATTQRQVGSRCLWEKEEHNEAGGAGEGHPRPFTLEGGR